MGGRPTGVAGINRHLPSPSGPESLPPGLVSKRRGFDDGASDISSTPNSMMEYSGLYFCCTFFVFDLVLIFDFELEIVFL